MAFIEIKNLKKYYDNPQGSLHAVDGVSFSIEKGKTIGVVGESGCGKSTLGRTIMHLTDTTDGQVIYEGKDITYLKEKEFKPYRTEIQMIFQDPYASLDPRMNVFQLIAEPAKVLLGIKNKNKLRKKVRELMELVGLSKRLEVSYPHELDGGRRQRIGIARALIVDPQFIICDEPVSALDVLIQAKILNLMQDIQEERNLTYLFIAHDMSVIKHVSDDIAVMYLGQLVEKASADELFKNTLHPYSQALLSAIPEPTLEENKEKIILEGEVSSPINPKKQCRFAPRCRFCKDKCTKEEPELKEIKPNHFAACHYVDEINDLEA